MLLLYTPVYLATRLISSEFDIRSYLNQRHMCWNDMPQLKSSEYMVRHVLYAYMNIYPGSPERETLDDIMPPRVYVVFGYSDGELIKLFIAYSLQLVSKLLISYAISYLYTSCILAFISAPPPSISQIRKPLFSVKKTTASDIP